MLKYGDVHRRRLNYSIRSPHNSSQLFKGQLTRILDFELSAVRPFRSRG